VRFGAFDEALLDDANRVIASPGVSLREPFMMSAAIRGVPIIGDIELFAREAQAPIAASPDEWQEHGDDSRRAHGRSRGQARARRRQSRSPGSRLLAMTRRRISTCWSCRASSWIRRAR
jgi:hypothetical protein